MTSKKNIMFYGGYILVSSFALTRGVFLLYLTQKGMSTFEIAMYSTIFNFFMAIFEIPTGYIGDRIGNRNSMIVGSFLLGLHAVFMLVCNYKPILLVLGVVEAISYTFISGSDGALLYILLEQEGAEKKYITVNSYFLAIQSAIMGITIFFGALIAEYSWSLVYGLQALLLFSSSLILLGIKETKIHNNKSKDNRNKNKYKLSKYILHNSIPLFVIFVLGASISDGVFCGYYNINQLIFAKMNISLAMIGVFFSLSYFINTVAYLLVNVLIRFFNRRQIFTYCFCLQAVVFIIMANSDDKVLFMIWSIIACFIPEILFILADSIIQDYIISEYRATILSIVSMLRSCISALCYGLMGCFFERLTVKNFIMWIGITVTMMATVAFGYYRVNKKRGLDE